MLAILGILGEIAKQSVEGDVKKRDPAVQKLYAANSEFTKTDWSKLSKEDLLDALAISKALAATIEFNLKFSKKEKEKKEKEDEE